MDFQALTPERSSLVFVLTTGSHAAANRLTEHVVAGWHDLTHLRLGPACTRFVSLFDDTCDVWADKDFRLLEPLSDVVRWSEPDELVEILTA